MQAAFKIPVGTVKLKGSNQFSDESDSLDQQPQVLIAISSEPGEAVGVGGLSGVRKYDFPLAKRPSLTAL